MEDLITQLGVPGILIYLLGKDVIEKWSKRKNGNAKAPHPFGNPGHSGLEKLDQVNKNLEKIIEHDEKQHELLLKLGMAQVSIREDIARCEKEVHRIRRPNTG